jgi:uncharacterized repeat protein (TIGR03803 family)
MRSWLGCTQACLAPVVAIATLLELASASVLLPSPVIAQTVTTIYNFTGTSDGSVPLSSSGAGSDYDSGSGSFFQGVDGYLYGTTSRGGASDVGTVYRIQPDGTDYQTLYSFEASSFPTPAKPFVGLIQLSNGLLSETTGIIGFGSIFRILPDGSELQNVFSIPFDTMRQVEYTASNLVQGNDGYIYGGTAGTLSRSGGYVFRIQADGSEFQPIVLPDQFMSGYSLGKVLQLSDGYLYGTRSLQTGDGQGQIFRARPDGSEFQELFNNPGESFNPRSGLVQLQDGYLYGVADNLVRVEGPSEVQTYIYRILQDGTGFQKIFTSDTTNGDFFGELVQGSDGYLYGTVEGGRSGGSVYRVQPDGTNFQTLFQFDQASGLPSKLFKGDDCNLYGTTSGNQESGQPPTNGTIFKVTLNLPRCKVISPIADGLGIAYGVAFNVKGNYLVPNIVTGQLQEVKLDGSSQQVIASNLGRPTSVAVRSNGNYLVTDARGSLLEINPSDGSINLLASNLGRPFGVAIDSSDTAIVTDRLGGRLLSVNPSGSVNVIAGDLGSPNSVVVDSVTRNYLVTDRRGRLLQVTPTGTVTVITNNGLGLPTGLALDGGSALVLDATGNRLLRVSLGYQPGTIKVLSANPQLRSPQAIVVIPGIQGQYAVTDIVSGQLLNLK